MVERLLGLHLTPFFDETGAFRPNQFTYTCGRGYKDALAVNTLTWVWTLSAGWKTAVYCSDVSGAFDRVEDTRLLTKLFGKGVRGNLADLTASWLRGRTGSVCVEGKLSTPRDL